MDSLEALARLETRFKDVEPVFAGLWLEAQNRLTPAGQEAYLSAARLLGKLGRGVEPMLVFLEEWPAAATKVGEGALPSLMATVQLLQKSPNGRAIAPLLQTLGAVARRLPTAAQLQLYFDLALDLMRRTTGSIHGFHQTQPSPALPEFFHQAPNLLGWLSLVGLRNWVDYGVRNHGHHPDRQVEYFRLQSPDSRAVLQRERHGTLLVDVDRSLDLGLRALWEHSEPLIPYSTLRLEEPRPGQAVLQPYWDAQGFRLPDVLDAERGLTGIERYRATLAHMMGHRRWSTPLIADNWSPFQRMAVEMFEDSRIDTLLCRTYPGLRRLFLALHPKPVEGACDPAQQSCLRHRLAMLSRALLDAEHGYQDATLLSFVERFQAALAPSVDGGEASSTVMAELALSYVARTRRPSDQFAEVFFDDTVIDYRDDNRHLWRFIEEGDEESSFDAPPTAQQQELTGLPPRLYPEWDYLTETYRPDWASVFEVLHPKGSAADIDRLLDKHAVLARRLKKLLDLLKPQDKRRIRFQEDGSELDLDVALRSLIDFKGGSTPDPRINMSHRTDGRDIAVLLLLDLSESLNQTAVGGEQTLLALSQEAVALLAWAVDRLGDPLAIAGFHSNTRHEVRYLHIKGATEPWDDNVKARLAAMQAGYSTRMGAAMRHAAHYLGAQKADKKLLLILTDGQPADVDSPDEQMLIKDARQAVKELGTDGIFSYCISLDPQADAYVSDIFGHQYTVIDRVDRLPEKLPELFMALTR
ncbi:MAG: nitric oxide reductase activation protein NorD [Leptothrix ochracea]|uniref:nitric oxide reductase activation protein NorD n=2 Tax=Leptothrix ochracea TaxID=735331 RepID=UPI0034E28B37